jgi:hypothetical protein
MEKNTSSLQGTSFQVIALNKMKTADPKKGKGGDLGELFKCVKLLSDGTTSLTEYVAGESDEFSSELNKYLDALVKIQQGMLEIANKKVAAIRSGAAASIAPSVGGPVEQPSAQQSI